MEVVVYVRYYTEDHEWVDVDGLNVVIGISSHAVEELGEIVYVELPNSGDVLIKGDEFGSVESVKTVSGFMQSYLVVLKK